eukprot:GEMP01040935.1.p1 GENE.GEMP01040935.1~~GEMP01040935.1.p1  ORF type:complete len:146 (+),score=19.80 GEMP01040935.1:44-439(+)
MRLLTHNLLQCNKKGVNNGYPLIIRATKFNVEETEFNKDFALGMLPKIEWSALLSAVESLREPASQFDITLPNLPTEVPMQENISDDIARALHFILFDLHIIEGVLVCPESGREFPVEKGIPNMLLHDDEV